MAKTEIEFVSGFDPVCPIPRIVRAAGLDHRFAVIQHTYRPDSVDGVFDVALFDTLMRFAAALRPNADVSADERNDGREVSLANFRAAWEQSSEDHRSDAMLLVRLGSELVACIAPEHWANIGGPAPYSDSYTYSIFSREEMGERVTAFLRDSDGSEGWHLSTEIITGPSAALPPAQRSPMSLLRRLFGS